MSATVIGGFTLWQLNKTAQTYSPLLSQMESLLHSPFGLVPLSLDLQAQFDAAVNVQASVGLQLANPMAGYQAALQGIAQVTAGIQAALSLGLPTVSAQLSGSISASAAVSAAVGAKLAGINGLLLPALALMKLLQDFAHALDVGPAFVVTVGDGAGDTLQTAGQALSQRFSAGLTDPLDPSVTIAPTDAVHGVMILTKVPAVWNLIQLIIKTVADQ